MNKYTHEKLLECSLFGSLSLSHANRYVPLRKKAPELFADTITGTKEELAALTIGYPRYLLLNGDPPKQKSYVATSAAANTAAKIKGTRNYSYTFNNAVREKIPPFDPEIMIYNCRGFEVSAKYCSKQWIGVTMFRKEVLVKELKNIPGYHDAKWKPLVGTPEDARDFTQKGEDYVEDGKIDLCLKPTVFFNMVSSSSDAVSGAAAAEDGVGLAADADDGRKVFLDKNGALKSMVPFDCEYVPPKTASQLATEIAATVRPLAQEEATKAQETLELRNFENSLGWMSPPAADRPTSSSGSSTCSPRLSQLTQQLITRDDEEVISERSTLGLMVGTRKRRGHVFERRAALSSFWSPREGYASAGAIWAAMQEKRADAALFDDGTYHTAQTQAAATRHKHTHSHQYYRDHVLDKRTWKIDGRYAALLVVVTG
jgi:hypothetical protein